MAFVYILEGSMEKAEQHIGLALLIDPLSQESLFYKAFFDYRKGDYKAALRQLDACLKQNPKNIPAYVQRSYCLLRMGRYQETLDFLNQIPDEMAVKSDNLGISCLVHLLSGNTAAAETSFAELYQEAQKPDAFQAHSYLFMVYGNMGKADEAFAWLEEALGMNSSVLLLSYGGQFANVLADDPRYAIFHKRLCGREG